MTTLLESVGQLLTPDAIGQIGKAIGVDSSLVQQGMNAVGPTVLGSLSKTASAPGGADSILKALPTDVAGSDMLSSLLGNLSGGGTSADMMQNVLGSGANAISGTLSKSLGFDVGPLMKMGVPLLAGLLTKVVKDNKLGRQRADQDAERREQGLHGQPGQQGHHRVGAVCAQGRRRGGGVAQDLQRRRLEQGARCAVRGAPLAAMYLVATASPSGGTGAAEELAAAAGAVAESIKQVSPTSLIGTAFSGGMTKAELDLLKKDAPPREQILNIISGGLAAVKAHSPGDAVAYRNMVLAVAQKTAEAAKEGGFLGIGGTQVSAEEQAALNDITAALA